MAPLARDADFFDHLELLRRYLLASGALFLAAAVAAFVCAEPLVALLVRPAERLDLSLYLLRPQERLLAYLRLAFSGALLAGLPVTAVLLAGFVMPALDRFERRRLVLALGGVIGLFAAGVAFAFFIVVPAVIAFFFRFGSGDGIVPLWGLGEYLRTTTTLLLAFPVVFESPVVLLLLVRAGILPLDTLRRHRRHAVIVILLLSAAITPPDVLSQLLLALPLTLLYEGTILVAQLARRREAATKEPDRWTDASF